MFIILAVVACYFEWNVQQLKIITVVITIIALALTWVTAHEIKALKEKLREK